MVPCGSEIRPVIVAKVLCPRAVDAASRTSGKKILKRRSNMEYTPFSNTRLLLPTLAQQRRTRLAARLLCRQGVRKTLSMLSRLRLLSENGERLAYIPNP